MWSGFRGSGGREARGEAKTDDAGWLNRKILRKERLMWCRRLMKSEGGRSVVRKIDKKSFEI